MKKSLKKSQPGKLDLELGELSEKLQVVARELRPSQVNERPPDKELADQGLLQGDICQLSFPGNFGAFPN